MKFSAIVLRNCKNAADSVAYGAVTDAFLSGGVFFDEIALLPYDAPARFLSALERLGSECSAVAVICDAPLIPYARETLTAQYGGFTSEYLLEGADCMYCVLPAGERGAQIVRAEILPALDGKRKKRYDRMVVRTVGAPAQAVSAAVAAAKQCSGSAIVYNVRERFGEARIEAVYDSETPKMLADDVLRMLATRLNEYVYATEDVSLGRRLYDALILHRLHISTAESFTAGRVGQAIVSIPGASAVFYEGLNTYDNASKESRLGVSPYTLKTHGAVSDEVAYEMAAGLIRTGRCDVVVSTTGIAGPQSDGSRKPVGLCYIAVGTRERVRVYRLNLSGDRETITQTAVNHALFYAYKEIN